MQEEMRLITFDPLWETMKKRGITQYHLIKREKFSAGQIGRLKNNMTVSTHTLITKYSFSKGTLDAMKHNRSITLTTLNDICSILGCSVEDVILYIPDEK